MNINWGSLANVAMISFGTAVIVVVLVSFALVGLSARGGSGPTFGDVEAGRTGTVAGSGMTAGTGTAIAGLCLVAVAAIVFYGLYIIVT